MRENETTAAGERPQPHEYLKDKAAGEVLGFAPVTLQEWRREGKGPPFVRLGRSVRYRRADLDAWAEKNLRRSTRDSLSDNA